MCELGIIELADMFLRACHETPLAPRGFCHSGIAADLKSRRPGRPGFPNLYAKPLLCVSRTARYGWIWPNARG